MVKKGVLKLSQVAEKYRLVLWVLLLLLTMAILRFPVHLKYEYHPVQSPYIFGSNLLLFGALYCIWMLLLLVLIFSRREAKWEKLALVCLFAVVFLGFWAIITPYFRHQDEWYRAAHIQYLQDYGRIDLSHPYLQYFKFPGLQLGGFALCQITGLSIFATRTVLVLFLALLLSALLYVLFLRSLKSPSIAASGVLLFILGNILISKGSLLFSSHLAYMFLISFLILESTQEYALLKTWQGGLIMVMLLLAATITHFITSVTLVLILAGIYLVLKIGKKIPLSSAGLITLSLIIVLTWQLYRVTLTFTRVDTTESPRISGSSPNKPQGSEAPSLARGLWNISSTSLSEFPLRPVSEGVSLFNLLRGLQVALGARIPLWALITKLSWGTIIYAFGSILWIKSVFSIKKLSALEKKCVGGLGGIGILTIIVTLAGQGGVQFMRYLMYAPLFTVPLILFFFLKLGDYKRWYSIALLAIILFALSLPAFFVNNDMIEVDATYPYEISARKFLKSNYGEGEELTIFTSRFSTALSAYYLPKAELKHVPGHLDIEEKKDLWVHMDTLVAIFETPSERVKHGVREHALFIYSQRLTGAHEHIFAFKPTHPEWLKLKNKLSRGNRIYSSDYIQIYTPRLER